MGKKRNGLLEIYRLIFCFWVMYYHNFFFIEKGSTFTVAPLAVDFFFILSGLFLCKSMKKRSEAGVGQGMLSLLKDRVTPIFFPLCFVAAFNIICMLLFVRGDYLDTAFDVFCYWWYVLYLVIAIAIFYLIYRTAKSERSFGIILAAICVGCCTLHYFVEERGFLFYELTYVLRTFACLAFGMLISYVPVISKKWVAVSIMVLATLIPAIVYLAYGEKDYFICLLLVLLFGLLVYFTSGVEIGGKAFDLIGKLSTRMYIYMAFVSMLRVLGLENHRVLFVIDLALSVLDVIIDNYRVKLRRLKSEKADEEKQ